MFRRHPILATISVLYLIVVGWVTLSPEPLTSVDGSGGLLWPLLDAFQRHSATDWITFDRVEFSANVAMFVPVGLFFLLVFGRRRWWLSMVAGFALTVAIETSQLFIPGRVSDPRDVLSNTVGAIIGTLVGLVLTAQKARRSHLAVRAAR